MPEPRTAQNALSRWAMLVGMIRTSRAVHPQWTLSDVWHWAVLFLCQLKRRRELRDWYSAGRSPMQEVLARRPALVSLVRAPYISTNWSAERRLSAIEQHYCQLSGHSHALCLAPQAMALLATIESRGSIVEVVLDSPAWFRHEGELTLNLFHDGARIYTLAFSLGLDHGTPVAYVGGLQGSGSEGALDLYRNLTQAMYGLRPRALLVTAFQVVCREVGLMRWLAVSDQIRVSDSPYFSACSRVRGSYNTAWLEHGGKARMDGFYDMPVEVAWRTHDATPPRKRNVYRRRYEMLYQLDAALTGALHAHSRGGKGFLALYSQASPAPNQALSARTYV